MTDWLKNTVAAERKVNASDLHLFTVTDDPAEAVAAVVEARAEKPLDSVARVTG